MNWKKMMAVGLAAVSMMVFVTGCGSDTKTANTELPKKIVIGLDDSFPPMGFKDDKGEIVGLDIDMAKEAAKRAGMEVEFKAIDWSSKEAELKSKKIDALWNGLTVSPEREKNIADGVIARYLMTKEPGKYKIVDGTDYGVDNFAVGFRKDDTALRDKINGILADMKKDGTADKIVEKWLGSSADLDKSDAK